VVDKYKGKNLIIGIPLTTNISQGVVTQKALNKRRTNKTGGTEGQVRSGSQSKLHVLRIADDPVPTCGWFRAHTDDLTHLVGRSDNNQRP
jgi:hypothetical protein